MQEFYSGCLTAHYLVFLVATDPQSLRQEVDSGGGITCLIAFFSIWLWLDFSRLGSTGNDGRWKFLTGFGIRLSLSVSFH